MANDKNLIDYSIRHDGKDNYFHSSGFADVQNGNNVGTASSVSFDARQAIEQSRQHIQSYKNSKIASQRFNRINIRTENSSINSQNRMGQENTDSQATNTQRLRGTNHSSRPVLNTVKAPSIPIRRRGI